LEYDRTLTRLLKPTVFPKARGDLAVFRRPDRILAALRL
jgi:hypothetical protein